MNETNEIHTGLYSEYSKKFFKAFFSYLKYKDYSREYRTANSTEVETAPDGETIIKFRMTRGTAWYKYTGNTAPMKNWIAQHLKQHVINHYRSRYVWNRRHCDETTHGIEFISYFANGADQAIQIHFTVAEAYFIYDKLLDRHNFNHKYSAQLIERMTGKQNDPLKTEIERVKREKIIEAENKFKLARENIYTEQEEKIKKAQMEATAEADAKIKEAERAYHAELEEINKKAMRTSSVSPLFSGFAA